MKQTSERLMPAFFILGLLVLWEGAVRIFGIPLYVLPSPVQVAETLVQELPVLAQGVPKDSSCYVSALTGYHLPELLHMIAGRVNSGRRSVKVSVPIARGDLLNKAYAVGKVEDVAYTQSTIDFRLTCAEKDMSTELEEYIVWE